MQRKNIKWIAILLLCCSCVMTRPVQMEQAQERVIDCGYYTETVDAVHAEPTKTQWGYVAGFIIALVVVGGTL